MKKAGTERSPETDRPADLMAFDDDLRAWMDDDGLHTLTPLPPDPAIFERMTELYQQKIRASPLWDEMVAQFGLERAEELLKEFRAEPGF